MPTPAQIKEALAHLRLILVQALPTDDAIIIGHVRDAALLLAEKEAA